MNEHFGEVGALIFDLDGTLWDTTEVCARGWSAVLKRNGVTDREVSKADLLKVVGMPHDACVRKIFSDLDPSFIESLIPQTMAADLEVLQREGGTLYPFVLEGLESLRKNFQLFIVSNCQAGYIENFLEAYQLKEFFADFECWGNTGKSKGINLVSLIKRNGLKNSVYLGDTQGDSEACDFANAEMRSIEKVHFVHAAYGFGSPFVGARNVDSFFQFWQLCQSYLK